MKMPQCEREQQVIDAFRSGRWAGPWGEEIRSHAAHCAVCSEVALVAEALRQEAESAQADFRLPSAGLVWWKAQLAARRIAEERAARPIAWVERMAQFLAALGLAALMLWQWPTILNWIGGSGRSPSFHETIFTVADWMHHFTPGLSNGFSPAPAYLLLASAAAFFAFVAFAAYMVWREE